MSEYTVQEILPLRSGDRKMVTTYRSYSGVEDSAASAPDPELIFRSAPAVVREEGNGGPAVAVHVGSLISDRDHRRSAKDV